MSTDRDVTRIVRSWLDEGATALPDRVLDAVLDQVPATSQRRARWPAWRFNEMNNALKLAIAAAAVVVVALVGINLLPNRGGVVTGPGPSPTPTLTQSPSPTSTPSPSSASNVNHIGDFVPGRTYVMNDPCCMGPAGISLTVPGPGWFTIDSVILGKNVIGDPNLYDIYLSPHIVGNLYTGGCKWRGTQLDPPVGPTVDDLATALAMQAGPGASPPTPVTVGGHSGMKVELSIPKGIDVNTCDSDGDFAIFGRWYTGGQLNSTPARGPTGTSSTTRSISSTSTVRARSSTRCTCRGRRLRTSPNSIRSSLRSSSRQRPQARPARRHLLDLSPDPD